MPASAATFTPYLVKDTVPGSGTGVRGGNGDAGNLIALNGKVYFSSFDSNGPYGVLWKSDGTEAGTVQIREDGPNGALKHHTVSNGKLFFLAEGISGDGIGEELWVSDGTSPGTFLVKDIKPGGSSLPRDLTDIAGTLFFTTDDGANGRELWKTDGTEAGTVMVKDINLGGPSSNPSGLTNFGGTLFFNANDGSGNRMWKSDGTESGTTPFLNISFGGGAVVNNGTLIFSTSTSSHGSELWRTDGTEAGTSLIKDIRPGTSSSDPSSLRQIGDSAYFTADDGTLGRELWVTDGSEAGTTLVKDINPGGAGSSINRLTNVNGTLFFQASDGAHGTEIWKSDGTAAGTQMVVDLVPGSGSPSFSSSELIAVNDLLFFTAVLPGAVRNNSILYVTDGTAAGTEPIFMIHEHSGSTVRITDLGFTGTHLFFRAPLDVSETGSVSNYELFAIEIASPATLSGDFNGDGIVNAADFVVWRDHLGANVDLHGNGDEIGESEGVVDMADYAMWKEHFGQSLQVLNEGSSTTVPEPSTGLLLAGMGIALASRRRTWRASFICRAGEIVFQSVCLFFATWVFQGERLMKLHCFRNLRALLLAPVALLAFAPAGQGAPFSAYLVKDIRLGSGSSNPVRLLDVNGPLFFTANDGATGNELWISDGTAAGTVLVKDINPGSAGATNINFNRVGNFYVFGADDGVNGPELWASDGTPAGTTLLKDIRPGSASSSITSFGFDSYNGALYFEADDGTNGDELWRTDGTAAGTFLVKDINPGSGNSDPTNFSVFNGILYFSANNGTNGNELWKSDGTAAGTMLFKDINPSGNSSPLDLISVGNTLFFRANNGTNGNELWTSDGTEAGTVMVKDIHPGSSGDLGKHTNLNGTLFFHGNDGVNGAELWKSDGTEAGTVMVKDINPGAGNGVITGNVLMQAAGNSLFFQANDGINGTELWVSDGTEAGTQMLVDLSLGGASSQFNSEIGVVVGDLLFFAASVPDGGRFDHSVYVTDGTAAGTMPVFTLQDVNSSGVQITSLTYSGGRVYFRAPIDIDPNTGALSNFELFAININVVPEPTSLVLLLGGVLAAATWRDRVKRSRQPLLRTCN